MSGYDSLNRLDDRHLPPHLRTDPLRDVPRIKIRVNVRAKSTSLPSLLVDKRVKHGVSEHVIYEDELPAVMDRVETETAAVEQATQSFEFAITQWVNDKLRSLPPEDHDAERPKLRRRYFQSIGNGKLGPASYFQEMKGRGIKPLISVEVIEKLPPPQSPQDAMIAKIAAENASTMAAMGEALGKSIAAELAKHTAAATQRK